LGLEWHRWSSLFWLADWSRDESPPGVEAILCRPTLKARPDASLLPSFPAVVLVAVVTIELAGVTAWHDGDEARDAEAPDVAQHDVEGDDVLANTTTASTGARPASAPAWAPRSPCSPSAAFGPARAPAFAPPLHLPQRNGY